MSTNWRISSFNGALLAAYFIPTWSIVAFRIMVSPIHGLYERPNVSLALFVSDHLQVATTTAVRLAWLLALGRLTVVAFFAAFVVFISRPAIRKVGGCDEALALSTPCSDTIDSVGGILTFSISQAETANRSATVAA